MKETERCGKTNRKIYNEWERRRIYNVGRTLDMTRLYCAVVDKKISTVEANSLSARTKLDNADLLRREK